MSKYTYPAASRSQNFERAFSSDTMDVNVAITHTTEGVNWPGYGGGKTAPNYTFFAAIKEKRGYWREHFAANLSSRALENRPGGVQTNTLNAVQVELIGTCDSRYAKKWGNLTAGVDYIYWPDAPQWALDELAKFFTWLAGVFPRFELVDGAPRGWVKYPDSYGLTARQRLTFTEWNRSVGILGHQHVPENVHGDPGDLNIKALVAAATGATVPTEPPVTPPPVIKDQMDPAQYYLGAKGDHVTWLGKRLQVWAKALGLTAPYKVGPAPSFTETDRVAVAAFQRAQGWTGKDADGYPGPETLRRLLADPSPKPTPKPAPKPAVATTKARLATWNLKSPTLLGSWPVWAMRRGGQVALIKDVRPTVLLAQEVGSPSNERWYDGQFADLGLTNVGAHMVVKGKPTGKWRAIWYDADLFERVTSGLYTMRPKLDGDDKQMAECILRLRTSGEPFYFGSLHTENQGPNSIDVEQVADCFRRAFEAAKKHNVKPEHVILGGDTNGGDEVRRWVENNTDYRDVAGLAKVAYDKGIDSINGWKKPKNGERDDYIFVHKSTVASLFDQRDGRRWSDHNLQLADITI